MKIRLQNIGKIKDSEVEIKSITVITGANGSGKSTIGKALFGVFNALNDIVKRVKKERSEDLEDDICGLILTWRRQLEEDMRFSIFLF